MKTILKGRSCIRDLWTTDDIEREVNDSKIVVFAKGIPSNPRCGFSEQTFSVLKDCGKPYKTIDISKEKTISSALRAYTGKKKGAPAVFINGNLVGTSERLPKMVESGELKTQIAKAFQ